MSPAPAPQATRVADAVAATVAFAGLSVVVLVLAGAATWMFLPTTCNVPEPMTCGQGGAAARPIGWTLLVVLVTVWGGAAWRAVAAFRQGRAAWGIPVVAAGVAVLAFLAALVVGSALD